jgi:hypothetical protein
VMCRVKAVRLLNRQIEDGHLRNRQCKQLSMH